MSQRFFTSYVINRPTFRRDRKYIFFFIFFHENVGHSCSHCRSVVLRAVIMFVTYFKNILDYCSSVAVCIRRLPSLDRLWVENFTEPPSVTLLRAEVKEVSGALTLVRLGRKSMFARCRGLPRNTWSPWGETHAQYRNSQFSKLVDNMPIPVNPLEAVVQ